MAWVGIILLIMLAGGIWVMLKYTLVNPFIFLGIILVAAIIVTLLLTRYKRLIRATGNTAVNFLVTTTAAFIALSGIIVALNFFTADFDNVSPEKVKIERKYQKTRHHSRRSGRRSYERGESYQAYFLQLDLPYVGTRELEITRKLYSKTNQAITADMSC